MPTDEALGHPTILWHCSSIGHSLFVMTAQAKNFPSTRNVILLAIRAESASRPFSERFQKFTRAEEEKYLFTRDEILLCLCFSARRLQVASTMPWNRKTMPSLRCTCHSQFAQTIILFQEMDNLCPSTQNGKDSRIIQFR